MFISASLLSVLRFQSECGRELRSFFHQFEVNAFKNPVTQFSQFIVAGQDKSAESELIAIEKVMSTKSFPIPSVLAQV